MQGGTISSIVSSQSRVTSTSEMDTWAMVRARIRSRHRAKSLRSGRLRAIIILAQGPRVLFRLPGRSQSRLDNGVQFHALADLSHCPVVPCPVQLPHGIYPMGSPGGKIGRLQQLARTNFDCHRVTSPRAVRGVSETDHGCSP